MFNINIENKRNILTNLLLIKLYTNEVNYLIKCTIFSKFFAIQRVMAINIIYALIHYYNWSHQRSIFYLYKKILIKLILSSENSKLLESFLPR